MERKKSLTWLLILFLIIGFCQVTILSAQNQTFRHLTTRDGLASGFVSEMIQDQHGFIWIGTNNGLSKYDGYSFTNYRPNPEDLTSISGQFITTIKEFDSNTLLIGTNASLELFDPAQEVFKHVQVSGSIPEITDVGDILLMDNGDVWTATADGLYHIPAQNFRADTLDTHFYSLEIDSTSEQSFHFNALEFDGDNTLWIGSDSYIHKFDLEKKTFVGLNSFNEDAEEILKGTIWDIHLASTGTLFITSTTGLVTWNVDEDEPKAVRELGPYENEELSTALFQSVTEKQDGILWIGTGTLGAIRWDLSADEITTFRHDSENENSINSNDDVHFVFVDNQENTWFGYHFFGISMMYSNSWEYTYKLATNEFSPEHPTNDLYSLKEDNEGNLWFTTPGGLVFHPANGEAAVTYNPPPDKQDGGFGSSILNDEELFLISGNGDKIYTFDINNKIFTDVTPHENMGLSLFGKAETETQYFFSTVSGEIVAIDKTTFEATRITVPYDESIKADQKPVMIGNDSDGNFLTALLYRIPGNLIWDSFVFNPEDQSFTKSDIQTPDNVSAMSLPHVSGYQPGVILMRLNSGIFRQNHLTGESDYLFQSDSGVINEGSGSIYEGSDGYLWMNNQSGIMRLDPVTESISYFETDDNRKPIHLNIPFQLQNGDIIFMGSGGYIRFNPDELQQEDPIQKIHITELGAGSTHYQTLYENNTNFEIDNPDNNLSISFLGLNYRDPAFTRYRYIIDGYDEDWNAVGTQRRVFLANLPPGDYSFRVQAAPRFGAFSESSASINFTILPPWWQTLPAYFLYLLLFAGGIFAVDRIQRRRLLSIERERARDKELEQAKEIEKAYKNLKAAQEQLVQQEKLASLGQLTAGIAHEIKNPLNFVNNFSEVSVELIEEVREEILNEKNNSPLEKVDTGVILDILNDIEANLRKIHEHGSRADSIVKSMLQHSRGGSGKMEPTPLNPLIKEYVNLSFHGMRAGKNPINVDIDLHLDESVSDIPLIAEDFSRVIVNLCNNAFDAMREKTVSSAIHYAKASRIRKATETGKVKNESETYTPKLTIRTKSDGNKVSIEIEDNGPGIPEEMKNKILQPFFTTKKGTDGTGLGLSITNDIIKSHGGEIKLHSTPGNGTLFTILLLNN